MTVQKDNELKRLENELRRPLEQLMAKPVSSGDTIRLLQALQPAFDELQESTDRERFFHARASAVKRPSVLRLVRSQLSSYSRVYWVASLIVFGMLLLLTQPDGSRDETSFAEIGNNFALVLPALLLASLAYSFRSWNREMRMIESITPYPPALLLIVRTMIVIGLDVLLGIAGSVYMYAKVESFPLLPFVLQWMSLLLLVSGVTAYVLLWKGFKAAFACALVFWVGWNGLAQRVGMLRDLAAGAARMEIQTAAAAAGLLLLALACRRSFGRKLLP
ncbi:hypothetical protein [Paenibacillus humicola]|uniref:hypothetical protein n=1 Tax=Paenibacillus humicola TaxID=3110540 RepID=UPI00237AD1EA|nr:hypothetical protein [Paenibacillus humicola]